MNLYSYEGAVMEWERCVQNLWKAETYAPSEAKARINLIYRWKKENGRIPQCKITLPGKIKMIS